MIVGKEDIRRVADLARLALSEEEVEQYAMHMNDLLQYVEQLSALDTTETVPSSHAMDLSNVFREDAVMESLKPDEALANAPGSARDSFKVPRIIE